MTFTDSLNLVSAARKLAKSGHMETAIWAMSRASRGFRADGLDAMGTQCDQTLRHWRMGIVVV